MQLIKKISTLFLAISCFCSLSAAIDLATTEYLFLNDPLDVIIPSTHKDLETLEMCIEGVKNCLNVRRVIVISAVPLTNQAEWFNERDYPFSKFDVALYLNELNRDRALEYMNESRSRLGWYYQQLLKLYAPFIIPDISSNVLVVDSDTIFLRKVEFLNSLCGGLYNPGIGIHKPYFIHMDKLLPGLGKKSYHLSGISHHILLQKTVLIDLFKQVEEWHQADLWKAFCFTVDPEDLYCSGASEYEIYFNFVLNRTNQVQIRPLNWTNSGNLKELAKHKKMGYDYVSYHAYMR